MPFHNEYVPMGQVNVWNPINRDNEVASVAIEVDTDWDYLVLSPEAARNVAEALMRSAHAIDGKFKNDV